MPRSAAEIAKASARSRSRSAADIAKSSRAKSSGRPKGEDWSRGSVSSNLFVDAVGDVADIAAKLPAGLVGMGREVIQEHVGRQRESARIGGASVWVPGSDKGEDETEAEYEERVRPFSRNTRQSLSRTGGRVVDLGASLAPGGLTPSESKYGRALVEGEIVPVLIEDAGNVAIVGGGVSRIFGGAAGAASQVAERSAVAAAAPEASAAAVRKAAGRAARAETAARGLSRASEATRTVARLGEQGSGTPARIFTVPAGAVAKVAAPAVERALAIPAGQSARIFASHLAERAEVGPVSRGFREIADRGRSMQGEIVGRVVKASEEAERLLPTPDEQVAMSLVVQGEAEALRPVARLAPEERAAVVERTFPLGDVTPEAVDLAARYVEGALPEEQAGRMAQAIEVTREALRDPRTEREVAGFGRERPLDPEQLGSEPLPIVPEPFAGRLSKLDRHREKVLEAQGKERAALVAEVERARRRAAVLEATDPGARPGAIADTETQLRRAGRVFDTERRAAEATPARAETRGGIAGRARGRFEAAAQREGERNVARGAGAGRRSGRVGERTRAARAAQRDAERRLAALDERHAARVSKIDEKAATVRKEAGASPMSAPARYRPAIVAARRASSALRKFAEELPEEARGPLAAAADEIPTTLEAIADAGINPEHLIGGRQAETRSPLFTSPDPKLPRGRRLASEQTRRSTVTERTIRGQAAREGEQIAAAVGNEVAREVADRFGVRAADVGLEDVAGDQLLAAMREQGLEPWDSRRPAGLTGPVDAETLFVPAPLVQQYSRTFGAPGFGEELARLLIDKPTRAWKHAVLAFSPRWHVGNFVGNALMATVGGGLTPGQLVAGLDDARRLLRESPEAVPRELFGRGLFADEIDYLRGEGTKPQGRIGRAARKSYALNGYVDDLFRTAAYLAKKGDGLSDEAAVRHALRTHGDFTKLTTFERTWIRRLDPFWSWHAHITRLAFRLPIESPARAAWVLHLADTFNPGEAGSPLTEGDLPLGDDRYLQLDALNPFGAAATSPVISPTNAVASLGPVWQLAAAAGTGSNLRRGGIPLSRPPGTANRDAFGRDTATPLYRRPGEFFTFTARLFPQVRLAQDLVEGPRIRYDTGAEMRFGGEALRPGTSRAGTVARYFGVPTVETVDEDDIAIRRREREEAAARSRARYSR